MSPSPLDPGYVDPVLARSIRRSGKFGRDLNAQIPGQAGPGFNPIDQTDQLLQPPLPNGAMQAPQSSGAAGQGTGQPPTPPSRARMDPQGMFGSAASPATPTTGGAQPPATGPAPTATASPTPARQAPPGTDYASQIAPLAQRQAQLTNPAGTPMLDAAGKPIIDPQTGQPMQGQRPVLQSKGVPGALQRVALALLSATKLAPYAQQIVHPQFTQELASNAAQLQGIQAQLGTLKEASAAQEQQAHAAYFEDLPKARIEAAAERAAGTKASTAAREAEEDLKRRQAAFQNATKGLNPLYLQQGDQIPDGWSPVRVPDPNMPEGFTAYVPSPVATLPAQLQSFLPQYQVGQQIPRTELNSALAKYQTQLEQMAVKGATVTHEPAEQQFIDEYRRKNPNASVADAITAYNALPKPEKPKEATPTLMIGPDRKVIELRPGMTVPQGSVTPSGESTENIPTAATRGMAEKAPRVLHFVDRIGQLLDANEKQIGPLASRWNEFTAGRIGLPNQGYTQLRTDVGLLETALMNMHVGARGGERIMEHFHNLINTATQSPENLRAALGEIRLYAQQVAQEGTQQGAAGASPKTDINALRSKYKY